MPRRSRFHYGDEIRRIMACLGGEHFGIAFTDAMLLDETTKQSRLPSRPEIVLTQLDLIIDDIPHHVLGAARRKYQKRDDDVPKLHEGTLPANWRGCTICCWFRGSDLNSLHAHRMPCLYCEIGRAHV